MKLCILIFPNFKRSHFENGCDIITCLYMRTSVSAAPFLYLRQYFHINNNNNNFAVFATHNITTHWVLKAPLCDSCSAHIGNSISGRQAGFIHTRDQKLWTRKMKGFRFLGVGGNRSARRKPSKVGMESANQIHIQPIALGVVCHPDSEQNGP